MKKVFQALIVCALNVVILFPSLTFAATYLPDKVSIENPAEVYKTGDAVNVTFTDTHNAAVVEQHACNGCREHQPAAKQWKPLRT